MWTSCLSRLAWLPATDISSPWSNALRPPTLHQLAEQRPSVCRQRGWFRWPTKRPRARIRDQSSAVCCYSRRCCRLNVPPSFHCLLKSSRPFSLSVCRLAYLRIWGEVPADHQHSLSVLTDTRVVTLYLYAHPLPSIAITKNNIYTAVNE